MHTRLLALAFCASLALTPAVQAQMPFFPGAEGFGGTFTGAAPSGGWFANAEVYHVTNLNDDGPGSLREAFVENSANKIIVFDVGGVIQLTSDNLDIKNLSNYYIAGQTAPSPVTIYGDMVQITHSSGKVNENVILRYMTFRKGTGDNDDAITFAGGNDSGIATNMILDHVSASWAEDENLSVANYNTNITVQNSIIADALTSGHAYGSLIRPRTDSQVSFHHNLYANNLSRQPRLGNYNDSLLTADARNNVVYNYGDRAAYAGGSSGSTHENVDLNFVGNYTVAGPSTPAGSATEALVIDSNAQVDAYFAGNYIDSDKVRDAQGKPNGSDVGLAQVDFQAGENNAFNVQGAQFDMPNVTTHNAPDAYDYVVDHAGNWWWNREAIDARIVGNVTGNTNPPGGLAAAAPNAAELSALLATPMSTHAAGYDADGDGMEGSWELMHGLDPDNPNDWNGDFDADGYIDLVEFINDKGAFPAPAPIVFQGGNGRYAEYNNWLTDDSAATGGTGGTNWQPSRFDHVVFPNDDVTVDAPGQHAGSIHLMNGASLIVDDGWLKVEGEVLMDGNSATILNGGHLIADTIDRTSLHLLALNGGKLSANNLIFTVFGLTNNGSTIAPGQSVLSEVGSTNIDGDFTINSGAIEIELASDTLFDTVHVDGEVELGGSLDISFLDGYSPASGSWDIMTATGGFSGVFAPLPTGFVAGISGDTLTLYYNLSPVLPGDFNGDGMVDILDLDILSGNFGTTGGATLAQGDANGDGNVDILDLDILSGNFGASGPSTAVPEPGALLLSIFALVGAAGRSRSR